MPMEGLACNYAQYMRQGDLAMAKDGSSVTRSTFPFASCSGACESTPATSAPSAGPSRKLGSYHSHTSNKGEHAIPHALLSHTDRLVSDAIIDKCFSTRSARAGS